MADAAASSPAGDALPKRERKERKDKKEKESPTAEKIVKEEPSAAPPAEKKEKKAKEPKADKATDAPKADKADAKADGGKAEEKKERKPKGEKKAENPGSAPAAAGAGSLQAAFAAAAAAALEKPAAATKEKAPQKEKKVEEKVSAAAPAAEKKEGGRKDGKKEKETAAAPATAPADVAKAGKSEKKPAAAAAPAAGGDKKKEGGERKEKGDAKGAATTATAPAAAAAAAAAPVNARRGGDGRRDQRPATASAAPAGGAPVAVRPPAVPSSQDIRRTGASSGAGRPATAGAGAGAGAGGSSSRAAGVHSSLIPSAVVSSGGAPAPLAATSPYFYGGYGSRMPRKGNDGLYVEQLEVPTPLMESAWPSTEEGKAFIDQIRAKTGVSEITVIKPRARLGLYEVKGTAAQLVRAATELLDLHLKHQVQLQAIAARAAAFDEDLAAARKEMEEGLRVEFSVPAEVIGMVIGKGGANISRVKETTGVERIVVDADNEPPTVRIRGSDADAVAEARRQLEFDCRSIALNKGQISWIIGSLNDIRDRSKVVRIDLEDPTEGGAAAGPSKPLLRITGLKLAVNTACMLIETQLQFQEEFKK